MHRPTADILHWPCHRWQNDRMTDWPTTVKTMTNDFACMGRIPGGRRRLPRQSDLPYRCRSMSCRHRHTITHGVLQGGLLAPRRNTLQCTNNVHFTLCCLIATRNKDCNTTLKGVWSNVWFSIRLASDNGIDLIAFRASRFSYLIKIR